MQLRNSLYILTCVLMCRAVLYAQTVSFPAHLAKTNIAKMASGDSIIYYQCHVDQATQELVTSSGQKITSKAKKLTITEKFVVTRQGDTYNVRYYISSFNEYPNKKFAYLTLKEVANWGFELKFSGTLPTEDVQIIAAFEDKTHDVTYYELKVNKSCTNEAVIAYKRERNQLMVEGNYLLSKNIKVVAASQVSN